jgi:hypothetical protein
MIGGLLLSAGCISGIVPDSQTMLNSPAETEQSTQSSPRTTNMQTTPDMSLQVPSMPKVDSVKPFPGTIILGSPTNSSIVVSLLPSKNLDLYIEYGKSAGNYISRTVVNSSSKDQPQSIELSKLEKGTLYYYRVCYKAFGETGFSAGEESTFHTQRAPGSTFSFGVQGDSHPERSGKMFDSDLYTITMKCQNYKPDF